MTNANLPERWLVDRRFGRDRLPDAAYRSYMNALVWSVANRTEGVIEPADLKDIRDFDRAQVKTLISGDLWQPRGPDRGWLIADFATTQTGRDLLEKYGREKALDRVWQGAGAQGEGRRCACGVGRVRWEVPPGICPPESPKPNQTKTDAPKGRLKSNAEIDGADWCTDEEQARLKQRADRLTQEAYE